MKVELTNAQKEVDRLRKNRIALFDAMLDMVVLIRGDHIIEYMNAAAHEKFGDLLGRTCHHALDGRDDPCPDCPVELTRMGCSTPELFERKLGRLIVEYNYSTFHGYKGEQLVMIVMRDISRRKQQEARLAAIHNNIEDVLRRKIRDLNESERVRQELSREVNLLKQELESHGKLYYEMVGKSRKFHELREMINHVADSETTILITGESGTGKELVADIIHKRSRRRDMPFLKFNCAAVSESLLESDLFGYEKGSFTGANARRIGKFEFADKGTLFLDEIGDISPGMQSSLLRVLENGEIIRVGGNETVNVDVRIIAATNVDLATAVEKKKFRRDLFYRLNVINIHLPPLRERREDILPLISHFIKKYRTAFKKEVDYLPDRILDRLLKYDWPGNIRELENAIKRAVLLAKNNVITDRELSLSSAISCQEKNQGESAGQGMVQQRLLEQPLKDSVAELEARVIASALDKYEGNPKVISRVLGLSKTSFYEKMKRYDLLKRKQ